MSQAIAKNSNIETLRNVLMAGKAQIQTLLSEEMDAERLVRLACNAASRSPKLAECTPQSVGLSLLAAGELGLEPNGRDAHLVPFYNTKIGRMECQFMPDFKGLIKLAYKSKLIERFDAKAVRKGDAFDFQYGSEQYLLHKPNVESRGELVAAWALVKMKDGSETFVVLTADEIEKRRKSSQAGSKDFGPWKDWPDEMWIKTAVKVLAKLIPLGTDFGEAVNADNAIEAGVYQPKHHIDFEKQKATTVNVEAPSLPEPMPAPELEPPEQSQSDTLADKIAQQTEQVPFEPPKQEKKKPAPKAKEPEAKPPVQKSLVDDGPELEPPAAKPEKQQQPDGATFKYMYDKLQNVSSVSELDDVIFEMSNSPDVQALNSSETNMLHVISERRRKELDI